MFQTVIRFWPLAVGPCNHDRLCLTWDERRLTSILTGILARLPPNAVAIRHGTQAESAPGLPLSDSVSPLANHRCLGSVQILSGAVRNEILISPKAPKMMLLLLNLGTRPIPTAPISSPAMGLSHRFQFRSCSAGPCRIEVCSKCLRRPRRTALLFSCTMPKKSCPYSCACKCYALHVSAALCDSRTITLQSSTLSYASLPFIPSYGCQFIFCRFVWTPDRSRSSNILVALVEGTKASIQ